MASSEPDNQPPSKTSLLPTPWRSPWGQLKEDLGRDLPAVVAQGNLYLQERWRVEGIKAFLIPLIGLLIVLALVVALIFKQQATGAYEKNDDIAAIEELFNPTQEINVDIPEPKQIFEQESKQQPELSLVKQPSLDPLLELLQAKTENPLITALHPMPEQGVLRLIPSQAFEDLTAAKRAEQADAWLEKTRAMGFTDLELQTATGVIEGRSARVGQGMILFSPSIP